MLHPTPVPGCLPWCTDHHVGIDGSHCRTRIQASYGELVLSHTPDEGTLVRLFGDDGMVVLRMPEAAHLTHALALFTYAAAPQGELVGGAL